MIPLLVASLLKEGLGMLGGAVLEKGKAVVEEKLGIKLPDLDQAVPPEQLAALKQAEMAHEEWLIEAGIRREAAAYADTANARGMQLAALGQEDLFSKRFIYYFSAVIFAFSAIYIVAITFGTIPKDNQRFADTILGFLLGTLLATVINFFYGTSKSSQSKDATIQELTKGGSK